MGWVWLAAAAVAGLAIAIPAVHHRLRRRRTVARTRVALSWFDQRPRQAVGGGGKHALRSQS